MPLGGARWWAKDASAWRLGPPVAQGRRLKRLRAALDRGACKLLAGAWCPLQGACCEHGGSCGKAAAARNPLMPWLLPVAFARVTTAFFGAFSEGPFLPPCLSLLALVSLAPPSSWPISHVDRDCLTEAKRTASAEVKYDWWGDEEDEEDEQPVVLEKVGFECPKKCGLQETRSSSDLYQCNLCGQRLPKHARIYSCRTCDFDACGLCYSRVKPEDAGVQQGAGGSRRGGSRRGRSIKVMLARHDTGRIERAAAADIAEVQCPGKHTAHEYCTPDAEWACDGCRAQQVRV